MASLVAKNYSNALFELAEENNVVDEIRNELVTIVETLNDHEDLYKTLVHPSIEKDDKKTIFTKVFDGCNKLVKNFFFLLIDKDRINLLKEINHSYQAQYRNLKNIDLAYVTSAKALTEGELDKIRKMLEAKTNKSIELISRVDDSLIAGIRVQINNEVIDNSVLNQLNSLQEKINKEAI